MDEQLAFMKLIAERLESAGINYMITGSWAMTAYAVPRMTRDIDLVIECGPEDADRIGRLFESDCYVDTESVREAITRKSMFNIIHNRWIIKADFIIRKDHPYRETEFSRRRQLQLEGTTLFITSPEDLILSKLIWSRESDSDVQKQDTHRIVKSVSDLDWTYLRKWAKNLDLEDLLGEVTET
jgi:hypothetical protein